MVTPYFVLSIRPRLLQSDGMPHSYSLLQV
jgi:hypothetical protein